MSEVSIRTLDEHPHAKPASFLSGHTRPVSRLRRQLEEQFDVRDRLLGVVAETFDRAEYVTGNKAALACDEVSYNILTLQYRIRYMEAAGPEKTAARHQLVGHVSLGPVENLPTPPRNY